MNFWQFAAVLLPAFVVGFGGVWLTLHNGLTAMRKELHENAVASQARLDNGLTDMRKELHSIAERVARIEGRGGVSQPAA